jgi:hypothetical protein
VNTADEVRALRVAVERENVTFAELVGHDTLLRLLDRIAELERERGVEETNAQRWMTEAEDWKARAEAAERRVRELEEEALRRVRGTTTTNTRRKGYVLNHPTKYWRRMMTDKDRINAGHVLPAAYVPMWRALYGRWEIGNLYDTEGEARDYARWQASVYDPVQWRVCALMVVDSGGD